ncbi:thermonuclease family protein [Serinicoccus sp. LYQ131]|uniref:thermonuclease family protein n=1 Tax=Serinicoccus sp. LYQ131 TaxID=3378797 RepID=UPI003854AD25
MIVGGFVVLTIAVIAFVGIDDSEPVAQAAPAATTAAREPAAETAPDESSETSADDIAAAEAEQARAQEAQADEDARVAAEKAAEDAAAAEAAAEKAAEEEAAATAAEEKEAAEKAEAAAAKEAAEKAAAETLMVVSIVDGDTVDVSNGARIRIAGIDTPERGECGYDEAGARMMELARDREAVLVKAGADSIDRYGRLIRYLDVDGRDVGLTLIQEGLAIARYDSRDGYGWHDREAEYVAADAASPQAYSCEAQPVAPQPVTPEPPVDAGTDPQFGTCKDAIANGYGPYVAGVNPEYDWYRDADSDGVVCER